MSVHRIRRRQHRAARVEQGVDAGFIDRDCLLLHGFVNGYTIVLRHLVELIDANETTVREYHGSRLQPTLFCVGIRGDGSGEANAGASFAGGGDGQGSNLHGGAEQLRFSGGRVAHQKHIDVTTEMCPVGKILLAAGEQLQDESFLDVAVAEDGGRHAFGQNSEHVVPPGQSTDVAYVVCREDQTGCSSFVSEYLYVINKKHSLEITVGKTLPGRLCGQSLINTRYPNSVSWLYAVHQVVVKHEINGARKLSNRSPLWHFLQHSSLVVLVDAESELHFQRISALVLRQVDGSGNVHKAVGNFPTTGIYHR